MVVYDVLRNGLVDSTPRDFSFYLKGSIGSSSAFFFSPLFVWVMFSKFPVVFWLLGEREETRRQKHPVVPYSPGGATTMGCGPFSALSVSRRVHSSCCQEILSLSPVKGVKGKINRTKRMKVFFSSFFFYLMADALRKPPPTRAPHARTNAVDSN